MCSLNLKNLLKNNKNLTLCHLILFEVFAKKADRMWLCLRVTLVPKVVESCSKAQKTQLASLLDRTKEKIIDSTRKSAMKLGEGATD